MILLIDARNMGSKPSGIGMYAYNWVKAISKNDHIEVHVIVDVIESNQIKELQSEGKVAIHCMGMYSNKSLSVFKYFKYVQKIINEVKPDIFWEVNNLAPIKLKNPYGEYIVTIHDMFPITMPDCFGKIYPHYFRYGVGKTIKSVDGIIYISNYSKKEVEKYFPRAKGKKNLVGYIIIPPIPNMNVEASDFFLYMGNLEKRKGVDILLDAYEGYVKAVGSKELILAGKVREEDIDEKLKEMSKRTPGLKYLGYVDEETRTRLYRECGCFVFPSRAEGFGMPLIEAMQCGKPVIASDLEIFKELVGDAIETFELNDDGEDAIRLCNKMLTMNLDNINLDSLVKESEKYSEEALNKRFVNFLQEI